MPPASASPSLSVLTGALLVDVVVSMRDVGMDDRPFSQFQSWAGPVFLLATLGVFMFGAAGFTTSWRRPRLAAYFAFGMGAAATVTVLIDYSRAGGPPATAVPFVLGSTALILSTLLFLYAVRTLAIAARRSSERAAGRPASPPV